MASPGAGGNERQTGSGQSLQFVLLSRAFQVREGPCKALGVALENLLCPT